MNKTNALFFAVYFSSSISSQKHYATNLSNLELQAQLALELVLLQPHEARCGRRVHRLRPAWCAGKGEGKKKVKIDTHTHTHTQRKHTQIHILCLRWIFLESLIHLVFQSFELLHGDEMSIKQK